LKFAKLWVILNITFTQTATVYPHGSI